MCCSRHVFVCFISGQILKLNTCSVHLSVSMECQETGNTSYYYCVTDLYKQQIMASDVKRQCIICVVS